jgi:hypothetical protein
MEAEVVKLPSDATAPVHYVGRRVQVLDGAAAPRKRTLDELALEAWKSILQREYGGAHRDSPADAAQIAYEYAEAFAARRDAK